MKNKKSFGYDNMSNQCLKFIQKSISRPLTHLINVSIKNEYVPDWWKTAKIVPLLKTGDPTNPTNYRPISLLSTFSKVIEKIIAKQVVSYMNKYDIFYDKQFGFRKGMSCEDLLLQLSDDIHSAKKSKKYFMSIFIDLKKAFDTVNFDILLTKLKHYGIPPGWFRSYLTGRKQYTYLNGEASAMQEVVCGVPQGSILGPLLFLIYINDMPGAVGLHTLLYADDTSYSNENEDLEVLFNETNSKLALAEDWFAGNQLTLHPGKTRYILFSPKAAPVPLRLCGSEIARIGTGNKEKAFKLVGVWLDDKLNWQHHVQQVKRKVSYSLIKLARNKACLPYETRLTLYTALIQSHLEYCTLIWGAAAAKEIHQLEVLQKKGIRVVNNAKYNSHCDPLFANSERLKLCDIYKLACIKRAIIRKKEEVIPVNIRTTRSTDDTKLIEQLAHSMELTRLATHNIITKWNGLDEAERKHLLCAEPKSISSYFKNLCLTTYNTFACEKENCYACSS